MNNNILSDVCRQYENNMEKVFALIQNMKDLTQLKTSYNLLIGLEDYVSNSLEENCFFLLHRVQIHHIEHFVNEFIFSNLNQRGISTLNVLIR